MRSLVLAVRCLVLTATALICGVAGGETLHTGTVLITGSNRGIGFGFARLYAERGWTVIATARHPRSAKELNELAAQHRNVTVETLDVADDSSIKLLAHKYQGKPIDVLLNNAIDAGDVPGQTFGTMSYDTFQQVMHVNVFGPLAVSQAFLANVLASEQKKIVAITSGSARVLGPAAVGPGANGNSMRLGPNPLNDPAGHYKVTFYLVSKSALNMAMYSLAGDLREQKVIVGIIDPGVADTGGTRAVFGDMAARFGAPEEAAGKVMKVIDGLTLAGSGKPFGSDGVPWYR